MPVTTAWQRVKVCEVFSRRFVQGNNSFVLLVISHIAQACGPLVGLTRGAGWIIISDWQTT